MSLPQWLLRLHERAALRRGLTYAAVFFAAGYILWLGHPSSALTPGAPPLSDLGGHLVALQYLIDVSLPSGHFLDWSNQWFAGYPSFYFYFPLPALTIAGLAQLMPLNVAAKLFAVSASALLAPATYVFARTLGFSRIYSLCAVTGAVAFAAMTSQYILGGNVLSSVIGEYSYAFGFACALLYLSRVSLAQRGQDHHRALAITLAATALSHPIAAVFAVAGSCSALSDRHARRQIFLSWIIAFGLAAFWAVPFLVRSNYMGRIEWSAQRDILDLFPLSLLVILPWTLASVVTLSSHRNKLKIPFALGAAALLLYVAPHGLFAPGRSLPLWHFVLFIGTGLGVAAGLERAWQRQQRVGLALWAAGLVMLIGVAIVQSEIVRRRSAELLTENVPNSAPYQSLLTRLAKLPAGRLHWEYRRDEAQQLGSRIGLSRVPSVLPHIQTSQGLLLESALTSPAYWQLLANVTADSFGYSYSKLPAKNLHDPARMSALLRQLGVNYFVSLSPALTSWAQNATGSFEKLASESTWTLWSVRGSRLVDPLVKQPNVITASHWNGALVQWLETVTDTSRWTIVASHPMRFKAGQPADTAVPVRTSLEHRRIKFTTRAIGVPHIIRVSYFPNWHAYGADGPYLAVPGFMLVVPRGPNVELRFEASYIEYLGSSISLLTLVFLFAITLVRRSSQDSSWPTP